MNEEAMVMIDEREMGSDLTPPSKQNRAQMPVVMNIKTKPTGAFTGPLQSKKLSTKAS